MLDLDLDVDLPDVDASGCGPGLGLLALPLLLIAVIGVLLAHWMITLSLALLVAGVVLVAGKRPRQGQRLAGCTLLLAAIGLGVIGLKFEAEQRERDRQEEQLRLEQEALQEALKEAEQRRIGALGRFKKWALGSKDEGLPERDE